MMEHLRPVRVLVTSSRMPFALDAIHKLSSASHEVHACDIYASAPGSHSRYLAGHYTTASPSQDTPRFVADVARIAGQHDIDMILPTFEEGFYLSYHRDRLPGGLFTAEFKTLSRLHDKDTFQQLARSLGLPVPETVIATSDASLAEAIARWPRWFARAAFSRGGVGCLTNTGPLAAQHDVADIHPSEASPWLVQPFVDGPMICTYSLVHDGEVAAHCTYRAPRQWEGSTGIQFESIDGARALEIARPIARELRYTGQMSLDFVEGEEGLTLIECNPRMTDGLLLMSPDAFSDGLFSPGGESRLVPPGDVVQLDFAVFGQMFREGIGGVPDSIHDLARVRDPAQGWHDHMPALYSFLALCHHERLSVKEHEGLFEAMADGVTWDGQPIA